MRTIGFLLRGERGFEDFRMGTVVVNVVRGEKFTSQRRSAGYEWSGGSEKESGKALNRMAHVGLSLASVGSGMRRVCRNLFGVASEKVRQVPPCFEDRICRVDSIDQASSNPNFSQMEAKAAGCLEFRVYAV